MRSPSQRKSDHSVTWNLVRVDEVLTALDIYPDAQVLHVDAPAAENFPAGQLGQTAENGGDEVPAGHETHAPSGEVANVPGAQSENWQNPWESA